MKQNLIGAYQIEHPITFWTQLNRDQNPCCAGERVPMSKGTTVAIMARGIQSKDRVLCQALDNTRMVFAWADLTELKRVL